MGVAIFLRKRLKFHLDFTNEVRNSERVFCLLDTCIGMNCSKFSIIQREYLRSAVNILANSYKTSDITKREIFQP